MEYDKIKQLMEDMGNSKLTSIDIDFADGTKIKMTKQCFKCVQPHFGHFSGISRETTISPHSSQ